MKKGERGKTKQPGGRHAAMAASLSSTIAIQYKETGRNRVKYKKGE